MTRLAWWGASGLHDLAAVDKASQSPDAWVSELRRFERLDVVVSGQLMHQLSCPEGLPLGNLESVSAYAEQQFVHYFGDEALLWPLVAWQDGQRSGAAALKGAAGQGWGQWPSALRRRIVRMTPAWASALGCTLRRVPALGAAKDAAFIWVEDNLMTWVTLRAARVQHVQQLRLRDRGSDCLAQAIRAQTREEALLVVAGYGRDALAASDGLVIDGDLTGNAPSAAQVHGGSLPSLRLHAPDVLGRLQRLRPLWGWALLALAGIGLTATLLHAQAAWTALQDAQSGYEKARLAIPIKPLVATPLSNPGEQRKLAEAQGRQRAVLIALEHPWEAIMTTVEGAAFEAGDAGKVAPAWLAMDYQAASTELRLVGQAPTKAMALEAVEKLSGTPQWRDVTLQRLQTSPDSQVQFELSARLVRKQAEPSGDAGQASTQRDAP